MSGNSESIDAQQWVRFSRMLVDALPVREHAAVVRCLAAFWLELTDARSAIVASILPGGNCLCGFHAGADAPVEFAELDYACDHWSAEEIVTQLAGRPGFEILTGANPHVVPFGDDRKPAAGAILYCHDSRPLRLELLTEMSDASSRLLEQASMAQPPESESITEVLPDEAKLRSLAEFAAGAGHEIHNPVATISGRVQLLLRDETDPVRRRALATIGGQAYRIRDMIGDLRLFAVPPEPRPVALDLAEVVGSVHETLAEQASERGFQIVVEAESPVPIWADRTQLCVVISNLIQNSWDALVDGGVIRVSAESIVDQGRETALLTVTDSGPGLSDADRVHLFDPFYSGRQAGRGLGFGLTKCWRIVSNHGGRVQVDSAPNETTAFRVYWPANIDQARPVRA